MERISQISDFVADFDRNAILPLVAAVVCGGALAAILAALAFEHIGGYRPCPLCLKERLAYYASVPLAAGAVLFALYQKRDAAILALTLVAAAFAVNAALGIYHSGIEWHWWAGPAGCSGGEMTTPVGNLLETLKSERVVRCDEAPWRFLGLSFAGYNALISAGLAVVAFAGTQFEERS
jgi:disulfide bond formation protein DsbB